MFAFCGERVTEPMREEMDKPYTAENVSDAFIEGSGGRWVYDKFLSASLGACA
jgi:hypothetical protein